MQSTVIAGNRHGTISSRYRDRTIYPEMVLSQLIPSRVNYRSTEEEPGWSAVGLMFPSVRTTLF